MTKNFSILIAQHTISICGLSEGSMEFQQIDMRPTKHLNNCIFYPIFIISNHKSSLFFIALSQTHSMNSYKLSVHTSTLFSFFSFDLKGDFSLTLFHVPLSNVILFYIFQTLTFVDDVRFVCVCILSDDLRYSTHTQEITEKKLLKWDKRLIQTHQITHFDSQVMFPILFDRKWLTRNLYSVSVRLIW